MGFKSKVFGALLSLRSRQLRLERERRAALEETNSILSAYLAILIEKEECVRVPRELVRGAIGKYRATVKASGDDYLIGITRYGGGSDRGVVDPSERNSNIEAGVSDPRIEYEPR